MEEKYSIWVMKYMLSFTMLSFFLTLGQKWMTLGANQSPNQWNACEIYKPWEHARCPEIKHT